jgi:hypothetical protein
MVIGRANSEEGEIHLSEKETKFTMKAKLLLRIASVLILIHLLGHALGHSGWDKPEDPRMQEVVDAMEGYKSEFMGATHSMGDYYNGYSLIMFFVYAMSISIVWSASAFADTNKIVARKILSPVAIAYLAFSAIEFTYFFAFAGAISLGAGILILVSIFKLRDRV